MNFKTLFLLSLIIVFSACEQDEPSPIVNPEVTLLTFKQYAGSSTSFSDDWIFITNESGDVLDIRQFEADETIVLKSDKVTTSDKVNVTIFHYLQPNTETIDFTSYLGITPNQTWIYKKLSGFVPTTIGTATFNVINTTPTNSLGMTVSTNLSYSSTRITSPASVNINLQKASERILVVDNIDNTPSYFEANNVQDGETIEADYYADFAPLQNIFTIDLSGSTSFAGSVYGIMNETGIDPFYITGFLNYSATGPLTEWGYNNGFDLYRISMGKSIGKTSRQYFKLGSPVTSIPFPDNSVAIGNSSFIDAAFTFSGDYQLRNSRWIVSVPDYNSILSWRVYSPPGGKQTFPKIPDEIQNLYPSLSIEPLVLKDHTFFIYRDGFTYSDFIHGEMQINSSKKPYSTEYQRIIIQN